MKALLVPVLLLPILTTQAIAQTSQGHSGHANHTNMQHGVHADATLNRIADGKANISHGPIPQIGWPAMTMDLAILEGAEIGDVTDGQPVMLMLEKGPDGMYGIKAMMPK